MVRQENNNPWLQGVVTAGVCMFVSVMCYGGEGLYRVRSSEGCVGFVSGTGEVQILPQYAWAGDFDQGVARVVIRGQYGLVDVLGRVVMPCRYEDAGLQAEGTVPVKLGGKWGYVDLSGKLVIGCMFEDARPFACGVAAVRDSGKWGYIDHGGAWVIRPTFSSAGSYREGVALVSGLSEGETRSIIDARGSRIFDVCGSDFAEMSEGLLGVAAAGSSAGWTIAQYYAPTGRPVFSLRAAGVSTFSEGRVILTRPDEAYVVDRTGHMRGKQHVTGALPFSEGLAAFWIDGCDGKRLFGFMDPNGSAAIPAVYDDARSFSEGLALVHEGARRCTNSVGRTVLYGGRWKYIDRMRETRWQASEESGVDFDQKHDWCDPMWPGEGIPSRHLQSLVRDRMLGQMAVMLGEPVMRWAEKELGPGDAGDNKTDGAGLSD